MPAMSRVVRVVLVLCVLAGSRPAWGQSTGTPAFLAPYRAARTTELGATLSDPGEGVAIEGFYRFGTQPHDFGFRAGILDTDGTTAGLFGVDYRVRVLTHAEDMPLDGALILGLGAALSDPASIGYIPIGLSLGRRIDLEESSVSFVPYFEPVLTPTFGDRDDVLFSVGLGVDIRLSRHLDLRVGGAIGDYDGISVSLAWLR